MPVSDDCFVALLPRQVLTGINHAMHMRAIVLVTCVAIYRQQTLICSCELLEPRIYIPQLSLGVDCWLRGNSAQIIICVPFHLGSILGCIASMLLLSCSSSSIIANRGSPLVRIAKIQIQPHSTARRTDPRLRGLAG